MDLSELHFDLPQELIAQQPVEPRDGCRLMVLEREKQTIKHDRFFNIGQYLQKGDVLVFNDSRVLPARLIGHRGTSKRELLLLKDLGQGKWEVMIRGKIKQGDKIDFPQDLSCEVLNHQKDVYHVQFNQTGQDFIQTTEQIGQTPTPPYIKQVVKDPEQYQTIYAKESGSAAAPTAGLHFTRELLDKLTELGIQQEFVTLHVGLGTFQPIKTEKIEDHQIHSEWYSILTDTYGRLLAAKSDGRRIIAVGTTAVRVLETIMSSDFQYLDEDGIITGETRIYIYPGYKFEAVNAMITNFHIPNSSLLALVYAFAGQDFIKRAYQEAIDKKYRFFSFGDAMIIG